MNDSIKNPSLDLMLKVHWPAERDLSAAGQQVVIELQFDNGNALASMSVPSEQLLQAAAQRLTLYSLISLAGFVSVGSDELTTPISINHAIAFDQLVVNAVSADMLEDEPDAAAMLAEFRTRLLKSLEHVDQAIASLTKA